MFLCEHLLNQVTLRFRRRSSYKWTITGQKVDGPQSSSLHRPLSSLRIFLNWPNLDLSRQRVKSFENQLWKSKYSDSDVDDWYLMLVPNSRCWWRDLSPTSKYCHQHIWSPTFVTNLDVTRGNTSFASVLQYFLGTFFYPVMKTAYEDYRTL